MKLTDAERAVICAAQLRRGEPTERLAKLAGLPRHSFDYALRRLRERGVLRPWVFVNPFQLGYEEYEFLFSIGSSVQREISNFQSFIEQQPRIIWYGVLGGTSQFGIRFVAKNGSDAHDFLTELDSKFPGFVVRKQSAQILAFIVLPKRYISARRRIALAQPLTIAPRARSSQPSTKSTDTIGLLLLKALLQKPDGSERDLARDTGLARATVSTRLKQLRSSGVLLSEGYLVSARALGVSSYKVFMYCKGLNGNLADDLLRYASSEPGIVNITHCLGAWDFELGIEVIDPLQISRIVADLYTRFEALIERVEVASVFLQGVSSQFLGALTR